MFSKHQKKAYVGSNTAKRGFWIVSATQYKTVLLGSFGLRHLFICRDKAEVAAKVAELKADESTEWAEVWVDKVKHGTGRNQIRTAKAEWVDPHKLVAY